VDTAESEPDKARAINAEAPAVLSEEAERLGAIFVHYSTDYVFAGNKPTPYVETDLTNPLSVYGRTKRDGEAAAARCRKHLVFRTSWVVGVHGANFIKTMLRLAAKRETLRVVSDQVGAPTTAQLLADTTRKILVQMNGTVAEDPRWGLYHLTAAGETSWNGLARRVIARATERGVALMACPEAVAEITTSEYPTAAIRPANSRLDTSKLRNTFGVDLPDWAAGVDEVLDRIVGEMLT
jgi:dTDP-4-dehydrorhamnose reductase